MKRTTFFSIFLLLSLLLPLFGQNMDYSRVRNGPGVSVLKYGADPTGVKDSLAAFTAAYAANDSVFVPGGTYTLSSQFVINRNFTTLTCESAAKIQYTGNANIDSLIYVHADGGNPFHTTITGCWLLGNAHITGGLIHAREAVSSNFEHLLLGSNSGDQQRGPASGIWLDNGNTNRLSDNICSAYNVIGTGPSTDTCFWFNDEVTSSGYHLRAEFAYNVGIKISHTVGTGRFCGGITIISGTSETNGYTNTPNGLDIQIASGCNNTLIQGIDLEGTDTYTLEDGGVYNTVLNLGGDLHVLATAHNNSYSGAGLNNIRLESGAYNITLHDILYNNNGGAITDNASGTVYSNVCNASNQTNCLPNNTNGAYPWKATSTKIAIGTPTVPTGGVNGYNAVTIGDKSTIAGVNGPTLTLNTGRLGLKMTSIINYVGDSGANNAIAGVLLDGNDVPIPLDTGLTVHVFLAHNLQAGVNTFNLNGTGAKSIVVPNTFTNLSVAWTVTPQLIELTYNGAYNVWVLTGAI